jgi:hypothetical protein
MISNMDAPEASPNTFVVMTETEMEEAFKMGEEYAKELVSKFFE